MSASMMDIFDIPKQNKKILLVRDGIRLLYRAVSFYLNSILAIQIYISSLKEH